MLRSFLRVQPGVFAGCAVRNAVPRLATEAARAGRSGLFPLCPPASRLGATSVHTFTTSISANNEACPVINATEEQNSGAAQEEAEHRGVPSESVFTPRQTFNLPSTTPSWYAGHMARAIRSMPHLLARYPPPLVVEARDARLPLTSINPVFENLLKKAPTANDGLDQLAAASASNNKGETMAYSNSASGVSTWRSRRLIVYLKRDLIDERLEQPIIESFAEKDPHQQIMFVDTRSDADVKRVLHWVQKQATMLASDTDISTPPKPVSERAEKRAKKRLSGAFRHTSTPDEGVRLLILGMPNVGKSSLLNALRRVGTGKGKAASTAPHPGHTRKLTGTVRISKAGPSKPESEFESSSRRPARRSGRYNDDSAPEAESGSFVLSTSTSQEELASEADVATAGEAAADQKEKKNDPPIYVYDTPGVMVPFLGHGSVGAERGIKLAIIAGIKDSLFDVQLMADYVLYRLNLRPVGEGVQPSYVKNLPLPLEAYMASTVDALGRTNSIGELLWHLASKAPGSLKKGNVRDLDMAAQFFLQHWRTGKLDPNTELDLNTTDPAQVRTHIARFFQRPPETPSGTQHALSHFHSEYAEESKSHAKKAQRKKDVLARKHKHIDKGIASGSSHRKRRARPRHK